MPDSAMRRVARRVPPFDHAGFTAVVEEHQVAVHNLCYRMLGDSHLAEDAAQETFLRAFRAQDRYDPTRSVRTWLLSIAAHHCIDELRRRALLTWLPIRENPVLDPSLGPEASLVQREAEVEVRRLLEGLKPEERAAIVLRYWHDMSVEEIAEAMNASAHAVRTRLYHARRRLAASGAAPASEGRGLNHEPRPV